MSELVPKQASFVARLVRSEFPIFYPKLSLKSVISKLLKPISRFCISTEEGGIFKLIISDCQMEDAGAVKFTFGEIVETKANLIVEINQAWRDAMKGTKPQIMREK